MIDSKGYRANVGIIVCNKIGKVLWAKRIGQSSWQFPQGGVKKDETIEKAVFRELKEEVGLDEGDVTLLHQTNKWLYYDLPEQYIRRNDLANSKPVCIGQKQKWFLLGLRSSEESIKLDCNSEPEFDDWRWVDYWYPLEKVVSFKREVYKEALEQLSSSLETFVN
ncbi:MAG: RNA pyrophosphohydrolase [Gammaproteobacteria bacterium]|nr:RNA pyrophosphohydrolase [Gammaproteobacteria bacterium]MDG1952874.1 RNA pyrophosphohydrolase [Gammaproteobacteria bacterium]MDG2119007.1 RNA pyrophosphohydrolase [Gammaproteobacteria bacterium]